MVRIEYVESWPEALAAAMAAEASSSDAEAEAEAAGRRPPTR